MISHAVKQGIRQIEADIGDEAGTGRKKVSAWKSFIFGFGGVGGKAKAAGGAKGKRPKDLPDPNAKNTTPTLRRVQKKEALLASGFKGKKGKKGGLPEHVPMAPSHIKPPSMPPPASALLTAAGAIAPLAPKGVLPPEGPPPKAMKATVEERFIRAVWNMDDPPIAPSHIKPPGAVEEDSWLTRMRERYGKMSAYLRLKYEIVMSIGKMYHYDAKVIAHPRALEALHISSRGSWMKLVEGGKACNLDAAKRTIYEMNLVHYRTLGKYMGTKNRWKGALQRMSALRDEVRSGEERSDELRRRVDWMSTHAADTFVCTSTATVSNAMNSSLTTRFARRRWRSRGPSSTTPEERRCSG